MGEVKPKFRCRIIKVYESGSIFRRLMDISDSTVSPVILIAHWLKTVRYANQILVIDGGRIVQQETHNALAGHKGIYADFIDVRKKPSAGN